MSAGEPCANAEREDTVPVTWDFCPESTALDASEVDESGREAVETLTDGAVSGGKIEFGLVLTSTAPFGAG